MVERTPKNFCPIKNNIVESLCLINLNSYETRVLFAIIRDTYGWQDDTGGRKTMTCISLNRLGVLTNIKQSHICRALKSLEKKSIIMRSDGQIGINKNTNSWLPNQVIKLPIQGVPNQVIKPVDKLEKITYSGNNSLPNQVTKITYSGNPPNIELKKTLKKEEKKEERDRARGEIEEIFNYFLELNPHRKNNYSLSINRRDKIQLALGVSDSETVKKVIANVANAKWGWSIEWIFKELDLDRLKDKIEELATAKNLGKNLKKKETGALLIEGEFLEYEQNRE